MKKRTIILLVVMLIFAMCFLTGCGIFTEGTEAVYEEVVATNMSNFRTIEGKEYLVYSLDTSVIYYMFSTNEVFPGPYGFGYSYFAPYISENGNFCRYINNEIVEIVNTNN